MPENVATRGKLSWRLFGRRLPDIPFSFRLRNTPRIMTSRVDGSISKSALLANTLFTMSSMKLYLRLFQRPLTLMLLHKCYMHTNGSCNMVQLWVLLCTSKQHGGIQFLGVVFQAKYSGPFLVKFHWYFPPACGKLSQSSPELSLSFSQP